MSMFVLGQKFAPLAVRRVSMGGLTAKYFATPEPGHGRIGTGLVLGDVRGLLFFKTIPSNRIRHLIERVKLLLNLFVRPAVGVVQGVDGCLIFRLPKHLALMTVSLLAPTA